MKKSSSLNCASFIMFGVFIFLVYERWYSQSFGDNHLIKDGIILVTTLFTFLDIIGNGGKVAYRKADSTFFFMCVIFFLYSFISGVFIATDMSVFLTRIKSFLLLIIVCGDVWYVSEKRGSYEWLMKIFIFTAILCVIGVFIYGYSHNSTRVGLSQENNTNNLGVTLVIGIAGIIYRKNDDDKWFLVKMTVVLLMLYAIALSGSRKSFISGGLLFVIWIIEYIKIFIRSKKTIRQWLNLLGLVIGIGLVGVYAVSVLTNTAVWSRMQNMGEDTSQLTRIQMYKDAFTFWAQSPLIGIGYYQYAVWSQYGVYSHSSYAEILACSGLAGFLLFYIPIIKRYYEIGRRSVRNIYTDSLHPYRMLFLIFTIVLFLGFSQIFIYTEVHMILLTFLFGQSGLMMGSEESSVQKKMYQIEFGY